MGRRLVNLLPVAQRTSAFTIAAVSQEHVLVRITRKVARPENDMVFRVGIEIDLVTMWVVEIDVISVWGPELT